MDFRQFAHVLGDSYVPGRFTVFTGPMKSGKTMEFLNYFRLLDLRTTHLRKKHPDLGDPYHLFKPAFDDREGTATLESRANGLQAQVTPIPGDDMEFLLDDRFSHIPILGIDEINFLDDRIIEVIRVLRSQGRQIVGSGLDLNFRGEPYGPMGPLLAYADTVHKLTAICEYDGCGRNATRTQRLRHGTPVSYHDPLNLVERPGDEKTRYEARCLEHHVVIR